MKDNLRLFNTMQEYAGRFRILWVVLFVLLLLGTSRLARSWIADYYQELWETIVEEKAGKYLQRAAQAFVAEQRSTRRIATELAEHPIVLSRLTTFNDPDGNLFSLLAEMGDQYEVGLEVYDQSGILVAWFGPSIPPYDQEVHRALEGRLTSYVVHGAVIDQLFISTPVRSSGVIIGALVVRKSLEVNYPLSNRFINREGLSLHLSQEFEVPVEFDFSEAPRLKKDGRFSSAYLYGLDSALVGTVSVMRPSRAAFLESLANGFSRFERALVLVLAIAGCVLLWREVRKRKSVVLRCVAVASIIWIVRYALLALELPSSLSSTGIFDPAYFASKFGGGIAKSIGEMFLSCVALLGTIILIYRFSLPSASAWNPRWHSRSVLLRLAAAGITSITMLLLLRAYVATIRSAVFDSTLRYTDTSVIIPGFELGTMVVNIFMISVALILVATGITALNFRLLTISGNRKLPWLWTVLLYVIAVIVYYHLHPNPLVARWYALGFVGGMLVFTYHLHNVITKNGQVATLFNLQIVLALSALLFYPVLDQMTHEKERERLELFAAETMKPVDGWLTFVVEDALTTLAHESTTDMLRHGSPEGIHRLAFTRWAESNVSREGYNCRFSITDSTGKIISQFTLGGISALDGNELPAGRVQSGRDIRVFEVGTGITASRVYLGSTLLTGPDGRHLGRADVIVAADRRSLFRGENPAILRNLAQEDAESFQNSLLVSEYRDGVLISSNSDLFPRSHVLPSDVMNRLHLPDIAFVWSEELISNARIQMLFARHPGNKGEVVAFGIMNLPLEWHLFNIVKVFVYYWSVILVVVAVFLLLRYLRGKRYSFIFRDRLLVALLITAIIPIVVLAVYARVTVRDRMEESTRRELEHQSSVVVTSLLQRGFGSDGSLDLPAVVSRVASDLGADVNLFSATQLVASSRPELYEAGILDPRLHGTAYARIVAGGKRFHIETEGIGSYQYAVGYAPVLNESGGLLGVVSIPTLYHQEQIDREVSRQNALLFGVYAVVILFIILIATTFANRIAAPLHRLTDLTRRVSAGDLDTPVDIPGAEGEIGALIESFKLMLRDLKRNRDELVQYERELAWKEMARQVAHEIKNPLTPMKLSLQHLRQTYKDQVANFDQVFDEVSRMMIEQIDTLSKIASEFSSFARMPEPEYEELDVNEVLRESVHLFGQYRNVSFDLGLDPMLPHVMADREELRRAFINIIRNGIQAMDKRGGIQIRSVARDRKVVVTISDEGHGISEEIKAKLFQPNFSTKTDGMGLGLAIVKKTIDDLRGTIEIESMQGNGAVVTITLPAGGEGIQ